MLFMHKGEVLTCRFKPSNTHTMATSNKTMFADDLHYALCR